MDFTIPEELKMLQDLVRRFVNDELMPIERDILSGRLPRNMDEMPPDIKNRLDNLTKELGLWSLFVPVEYGGGGINTLGLCLVDEEMAKTITPYRLGGNPANVLYRCNDEQKEKYFYAVMRGEKTSCLAQTEPNAGSDPSSMQTVAVRDGDNYILNGNKIFIGNAPKADFAMILAVTDKERRQHGGVTCFLVDKGTPGFNVIRAIPTMGDENPGEISLQDCVVPATNILGGLGEGFRLGQRWIGGQRMGLAMRSVGIADRCVQMAADYAKKRVTFGRPIAERQAIQWMLADSAVDIYTARMITYHGAWCIDQGMEIRRETAMIKLYATEMVGRVVDRCLQIHGGVGYSKEMPFETWYRKIRMYRIGDGTSEIMRFIIARDILRD